MRSKIKKEHAQHPRSKAPWIRTGEKIYAQQKHRPRRWIPCYNSPHQWTSTWPTLASDATEFPSTSSVPHPPIPLPSSPSSSTQRLMALVYVWQKIRGSWHETSQPPPITATSVLAVCPVRTARPTGWRERQRDDSWQQLATAAPLCPPAAAATSRTVFVEAEGREEQCVQCRALTPNKLTVQPLHT